MAAVNPIRSARQYGAALSVLSGRSTIMPKAVARELVKKTPVSVRSRYAVQLAKKKWGPGPAKRRNPEDSDLHGARKIFRKFTGKKSTRVRTITEKRNVPSALADLGKLVELVIRGRNGYRHVLKFRESGRVRVATPGDGGQLYFVEGDQSVDLRKFDVHGLPKDQVNLGTLETIVYFTSKDFHNFKPSEYGHKFGEILTPEGRRAMQKGYERPDINYDVRSKRFYLVGGTYRVRRAGIVG